MDGSFWEQVDQSAGPDGCWPWTAGRNPAGYGQAYFGWTRQAHREAYRLTNPDFDTALDICHTCDNPPCCNPAHLFAGTRRENLLDASRKGRLGLNRLSDEQVQSILSASAHGARQGDLARLHGVSQAAISYVINGKRHRSAHRGGAGNRLAIPTLDEWIAWKRNGGAAA